MAINLGSVNISLRQFQEISSGQYNAGEVKLTSETSIDKVNNHVTMKFLNTTKISQEEVLAIKNAFVKALKSGGVDTNELNRIREELGLAPMKPVDRTLHERSIKPLSRQQIRDILDRNAAAINDHEGPGTIRTSAQLHARVREETQASRNAEREAVNAELNTRRDIIENKSINDLQAVLAGDVDFVSYEGRKDLLATARQCLDAVLIGCKSSPRDDQASLKWTASGGKCVVLTSGLTEKALVRKLEDIIVRLARDGAPSREELAIRDAFKALATPEARATWAGNLASDPTGAFKARTVAVMIMHDRGIADAETLAVVNKLNNADAIQFAASLVAGAMNLEGDALRASAPVQTALARVDPDVDDTEFKKAYIPALTDQEFNEQIASNMKYHVDRLPVTFRMLVQDAAFEVRAHFGATGYPDDANPTCLTRASNMTNLVGANDPHAPRITTESLRGPYIQEALAAGAERVLQNGVETRLKEAGLNVKNPIRVANALQAREPAIAQRILAAPSPEAADAVLNDYKDIIMESVHLLTATARCHKSIEGWAKEALAKKLGVGVQSLSDGGLNLTRLVRKSELLVSEICNRQNKAATDAEIEAEFRKLVDKYVNERMQLLGKIDAADMTAEAKTAIKATVLALAKVDYLDIDKMLGFAKTISPDKLANLLASNAPKERIFEAMDGITAAVTAAMDKMFEAAEQAGKGIGADEEGDFIDVLIRMVVLSKPGLGDKLAKFLASPAMAQENVYELGVRHPAANFMMFKLEPDALDALVSKDFVGYMKLAGINGDALFTSDTIAPGNGPAATAFRSIVDTRGGAPADASPVGKAWAFADKVNMRGAKEMAFKLALVASKNLVAKNGDVKKMDVESVNYQFNRDLRGGYKFFFPGVEGFSLDYNTNRDNLVRFVTDDNTATFATATEATKRKVGVLMAMLTQYTSSMVTETVSGALALPGSANGFFAPGVFGVEPAGPEFHLSKDADGNIKIITKDSQSVSMLQTFAENDEALSVNTVKPGSYYAYEMEITLPKSNLETLSSADWTQYNREAVNDYVGDIDGRNALIPDEFRFTGTVNIAYHMHLNEA